MFHCPVGVWVIEPHAIMVSATGRTPTVVKPQGSRSPLKCEDQRQQGTHPCAMNALANNSCEHLAYFEPQYVLLYIW